MQIADKTGGRYRIVSSTSVLPTPPRNSQHSWLLAATNSTPAKESSIFDHTDKPATAPAVVKSSRSQVIVDTIRAAYQRLGFDTVDDEAFFQLVLARLIEPTSKSDSVRVLSELGVDVVHRNTFLTCLKRARDHNYRDQIAAKCFDYSVATTGISLFLYDLTTLYFEAEKEDRSAKGRILQRTPSRSTDRCRTPR